MLDLRSTWMPDSHAIGEHSLTLLFFFEMSLIFVLQCNDLYLPTPIKGKHPCELGQNTGGLEVPTTVFITETSFVTAEPGATAPPLKRWQDMAWRPEHYGVGL